MYLKLSLSYAGFNSLIFYMKLCEFYFKIEFFLFSYRKSLTDQDFIWNKLPVNV